MPACDRRTDGFTIASKNQSTLILMKLVLSSNKRLKGNTEQCQCPAVLAVIRVNSSTVSNASIALANRSRVVLISSTTLLCDFSPCRPSLTRDVGLGNNSLF